MNIVKRVLLFFCYATLFISYTYSSAYASGHYLPTVSLEWYSELEGIVLGQTILSLKSKNSSNRDNAVLIQELHPTVSETKNIRGKLKATDTVNYISFIYNINSYDSLPQHYECTTKTANTLNDLLAIGSNKISFDISIDELGSPQVLAWSEAAFEASGTKEVQTDFRQHIFACSKMIQQF